MSEVIVFIECEDDEPIEFDLYLIEFEIDEARDSPLHECA